MANAGDCGPLFANEAPPHSRARRPAVYEKIWASSPSCDEPTNFVGLWPSNLRGFRLRQFWLRFSTVEEPGGRPFARKPQRAAAAVSQRHVLRNRRNSCLGCLLSIAPVAHGWPRAASPSPTSDAHSPRSDRHRYYQSIWPQCGTVATALSVVQIWRAEAGVPALSIVCPFACSPMCV